MVSEPLVYEYLIRSPHQDLYLLATIISSKVPVRAHRGIIQAINMAIYKPIPQRHIPDSVLALDSIVEICQIKGMIRCSIRSSNS